MNLSILCERIHATSIVGNACVEVSGIKSDSRLIASGDLFVALCGTAYDGHQFIHNVAEQGAVAIICQTLPEEITAGVTYIQVADSAEALATVAAAWNGYPSEQLSLVGVTGTNGKTTIATLLYRLFKGLGYKAGLLSTVCNYVDNEQIEATHTTPDPLSLNNLLRLMVEAGCSYAFIEVSSHAVDQKRIASLRFAGGIFSNLTRDHLDYHKTVDAYLKAKKGFFDTLPREAFALSNADDRNGAVMLQNCYARQAYYSLQTLADFKTKVLEDRFDGMLLDLDGKELCVQFVGRFNAYNLTAVYGAALLLGADPMETLLQLSLLTPVSGRFETLVSPTGYTAIVDYAHTPDALNNVLSTINEVLQSNGQIITVVGAGGNRDKGKRPLMAQEAVRASHKVILTSDNPRNEEPQDILNDMTAGLNESERRTVLTIVDRREAIRTAAMLAKPGDVILVAGKGHEDYQEIKGVKHHFDDKEELLKLFTNP